MKRLLSLICALTICVVGLTACGNANKTVRIGVSFGVGKAVRWQQEQEFMQQHAQKLGAEIEVRLNQTDEPKTQEQDCIEMIDSGIDVLILTPRDTAKAGDILAYAKSKKVPVISYARLVLGEPIDLFVGYDSNRIGQKMGQYLSEVFYEGDYILLRGDAGDNNAIQLYEGAMRYIAPIKDSINILLDAPVPGWSPDEAKKMVKDAVTANSNHVDAILAPNDKVAGAAAEALSELGVTNHVAITGMDAELDALKRIVAGTQDMTVYMNLQELANTAIEEAIHLAKKEQTNVNGEYDNQSGTKVKANIVSDYLVTKENLDRIMIESGRYTREEIYN